MVTFTKFSKSVYIYMIKMSIIYIYILIMRIHYINPFVGLLTGCHHAYTGYTWCSGRTSVYLYAASLQNLAVLNPLERSFWPCIRWCGIGGFQEQGKCYFIGLSCSIPTITYYFSISLLSVNRLVKWGSDLRTDRV